MKGGARIAIGVGVGYLLGRTRKMRWALALAGAAMSKRSSGVAGELLEQGAASLKSPELTKITETVRGELVDAVRSAAVTAASNRVDALNARLQRPPAALGDGDDVDRGSAAEADAEPPGDEERESVEDDLDEYPEEEKGRDDTGESPPRTRARREETGKGSRAGPRTSRRSTAATESASAAPNRRRARAGAEDAPVRRTRK
ncbi:hypothetical protein [Nocardia sp. NPDC019395]|uniref:hypothetical protein n=1 Tax=Nocardia sp. NPDC019395 TaxID=3154686 RepID=UPI0033E70477